jgi:hypothetical protein
VGKLAQVWASDAAMPRAGDPRRLHWLGSVAGNVGAAFAIYLLCPNRQFFLNLIAGVGYLIQSLSVWNVRRVLIR